MKRSEETTERLLRFLECIVEPQNGLMIKEQAACDLSWFDHVIFAAKDKQWEYGGSLEKYLSQESESAIYRNLLEIQGIDWQDDPNEMLRFKPENDERDFNDEDN